MKNAFLTDVIRNTKRLLALVIVFSLVCLAFTQEESSEPSWETMKSFCKSVPKEVEKASKEKKGMVVDPLGEKELKQILGEKELKQMRKEEQDSLQQVLASKNYSSDTAGVEERFKDMIRLGLFENALQYLESKKVKADDRPIYYLHLAYVQRWTEREEAHCQTMRKFEEFMGSSSEKKKKRSEEWLKRIRDLENYYKGKYDQWVRIHEKFKQCQEEVWKYPGKLEHWEELAETAKILGYRLEEIWARRVIFQSLLQQKKLPARHVVEFCNVCLLTDQPEKILRITDCALQEKLSNPYVHILRARAYKILKQDDGYKKELQVLSTKFPKFNARLSELWDKSTVEWKE